MIAVERQAQPMNNFFSRVAVAVVGLPLVLGLLWLGGWWLFALTAVAAFIGVHEFVTTARPLRPLAPALYVGVLLALIGARDGGFVWMLGGFLTTFVLAFLLDAAAETRAPTTAAVGSTVLGSAWIGLGLGSLILLRQMHSEPRLIAFAVVLTVFAADTLAYLTGRVAGRHKLAPRLSPKKTWEGLVGGAAAGIFVSFVALYDTRHTYLSAGQAIVLGVVVVAAAVMGDLFESALKRDLEVKDTGRLLGGHGGVLDRVDALLFAAPAAYFVVLAFGFH
ncbi:MAG TPA: phosphatidate cytidylyltransferase [Gaiellaceae bacterium]|nr:phosphatidate cytidylyltransferase [Gaiellaceae bacterium]